MNRTLQNIVVLTSGGDAPGMNAAIRAVVRTACYHGLQVYGSKAGYQGLVDQTLIPLGPESVANCIQYGGTILKADRCSAFYESDIRARCRQFLKEKKIDGMIVIGGNGSLMGATLLAEEGGPAVIGIPGTIDNDVPGTEYTIGFDTARNTALLAIDKIRDTASSHNHHFLVEVMGRNTGFLAVDVGIAGGAEVILIPELDIPIDVLAKKLLEPKRRKFSSIMVIAEGHQPGRSIALAAQLKAFTHEQYRVCILGHTQRGGSPTTLDRLMASQMGFLAVTGLLEGKTRHITAVNQGTVTLVNFPNTQHKTRLFTDVALLKCNDILCL